MRPCRLVCALLACALFYTPVSAKLLLGGELVTPSVGPGFDILDCKPEARLRVSVLDLGIGFTAHDRAGFIFSLGLGEGSLHLTGSGRDVGGGIMPVQFRAGYALHGKFADPGPHVSGRLRVAPPYEGGGGLTAGLAAQWVFDAAIPRVELYWNSTPNHFEGLGIDVGLAIGKWFRL